MIVLTCYVLRVLTVTVVKTNLGKQFLRIVDECFPKGHALRSIFNRNTLKLSYSCMPNIKSIIDKRNKGVLLKLEPEIANVERSCNCRKKDQCPLDNQCLTKGIVYQTTITSSEGNEHCVGLTDTDFKARFANHNQSFSNVVHSNQTELSKYVWRLKNAKVNYSIAWKILGRACAYSNSTKKVQLMCTREILYNLSPGAHHAQQPITISKRLSGCKQIPNFSVCLFWLVRTAGCSATTLQPKQAAKASKRKNRQRNNILWYNPPFSKNTSTNI